MGISTLCAGYILWFTLFQQDKTVLVVANNQQVAMNMIKKIKIMYDALPSWLKQPLLIDNKQSLQFKNNSSVKAAAATVNAGVSEALSLLVWDQAAILHNSLAQSIWASALPTISTGGDVILLSTPRGCVTSQSIVEIKDYAQNLVRKIEIGELYEILYTCGENTKLNSEYLVLTPGGWSSFYGVRKKKVDKMYIVETVDRTLRCSQDHLLKLQNGSFKQVKDIDISQILYGSQHIINKTLIEESQDVFDLLDVQEDNQYYTNGLVSHNCGHTFHKLWMQAQQHLNPFNTIKLPWFVHPQRDQEWRDKQTKALGQKKSNRQYDCLGGQTYVRIKDEQTGQIKNIKMNDLFQVVNDE